MKSSRKDGASSIRRVPTATQRTDRELARAMQVLHEEGPAIVVHLRAEVDRLQDQIARLERAERRTRSGRGESLVELLRG